MAKRVSVKAFGVIQGGISIALVIAIVLYFRRRRDHIKMSELRTDSVDIWTTIKRTPVQPAPPNAQASRSDPLKIESAFPTWSKDTPAYEILGVPPSADNDTIEQAYKKLLKKYHPDRFASWGKGYQTRAHHTILLVQAARDRMLKK